MDTGKVGKLVEGFGLGFPPIPGFGGKPSSFVTEDGEIDYLGLGTEGAQIVGTVLMIKPMALIALIMMIGMAIPTLKEHQLYIYLGSLGLILFILLLKKFIFKQKLGCEPAERDDEGNCTTDAGKANIFDSYEDGGLNASVLIVFWRCLVIYHLILVVIFTFLMPFIPKSTTSITDTTPTLTDTPSA